MIKNKLTTIKKSCVFTSRIIEACNTITVKDCTRWTRHSEKILGTMLQKEVGLK